MTLKINSFILFILVACSSIGQIELSAREAVFIALENNYQIQVAELQHDINEKNNNWMEAGLFPTVNLVVGQSNTIQDNTNNPFTFTPGIILSQSINPSLQIDWNLFSGFRVKMSKTRLEQLEEQSASNAMAVIESSVQDVLKAYYTAQLQKDREKLFQDVMTLSRERYQLYALKEKYNTSTSLELLQFKNQYLTDSTNVLMQAVSTKNAMRNLILLMNDSSDVNTYILTDAIDIDLDLIDGEEAKASLLENNQNIKNQYISLELQKTAVGIQRSFLYPTLSFQTGVNPGWSWIREIKDNTFDAETSSLSYYGNLNLRYTLFNNWKNKRAVEVAKIQEEIISLNTKSIEKNLTSTLDNLLDLYEIRHQMVSISMENTIYAEKAYQLARRRFELGTINSIDLATFQNNYQNTVIQHYENLFNRLDTYLEIYKMTGKISLDYSRPE